MLTASISRFRDKPGSAWASMAGVVLIVALLWAIGAVAQGQVERAREHFAQADTLQRQAQVLRCGSTPSNACEGMQPAWSSSQGQGIDMKPVPVAYR